MFEYMILRMFSKALLALTILGSFIPSMKLRAQAAPSSTVRVGVMLPIHNVDGDGRRMTEYYRGILMACDSLKSKGYSIDIHAWNVDVNANIGSFITDANAGRCNLIFGPLYTKQVHGLAEFCKARGIKLVVPFSIEGDDVARYQEIFQVYQSPEKLNEETINAFVKQFSGYHTVVIDCNDTTSRKGMFTMGLRNRLTSMNRQYSITNLNNSEEFFTKAFSTKQPNVVVLNTGRAPELTVAIEKLKGLKTVRPQIKIALFGYTEWLMYTRQHLDDFFAMDTYVPSTFYYNSLDKRTQQLERDYLRWFNREMMKALPRFALTGYDQAMFFIQGVAQQGKKFDGTTSLSYYQPIQTPFYFKQVGNGGMQNQYLQLIHYTPRQNIESVNYK